MTAPLKKVKGRYLGLTEAIVATLPATSYEVEARLKLPPRRAYSILKRLLKRADGRVIILGARAHPVTGHLANIYGRPEHLQPKARKRGPR